MDYYPIYLDLASRTVLLVGGKGLAAEQLPPLLNAGADVTIVADELSPTVRADVDGGRAAWRQRGYRSGDLAGFDLVYLANEDGRHNAAIALEARALGIWVSAANDPANCDFILPGVVRRGPISIATTTGDAGPLVARWLRERMEALLTADVVALSELLADVGHELRLGDAACTAVCAHAGVPPSLLCAECPRLIPAERWQDAIDAELRSPPSAEDTVRTRARLLSALANDLLVAPA